MDYEQHFEELAALAYRTAFRILGSRPDAEEATQEAMAKALLRWRRIQPHARAWVCRVAANEAIGMIRTRRRRERITSMHHGPRDVEGEANDAHARRVDRLDLQQALLTLPRRQREVLVLRYLADMSEVEAADALSITVGTVKTHAHRALVAMRAIVPPISVDDGPLNESPLNESPLNESPLNDSPLKGSPLNPTPPTSKKATADAPAPR